MHREKRTAVGREVEREDFLFHCVSGGGGGNTTLMQVEVDDKGGGGQMIRWRKSRLIFTTSAGCF